MLHIDMEPFLWILGAVIAFTLLGGLAIWVIGKIAPDDLDTPMRGPDA